MILSATIDNDVIVCRYLYNLAPTEDPASPSLTVTIKHTYKSQAGETITTTVKEFAIDPEYIQTDEYQQYAEIRHLHPRYLEGLSVAVTEDRGGTITSMEVPVLTGEEDSHSTNPMKDSEDIKNEENTPIELPENPVTPEPVMITTVFSYNGRNLVTKKRSPKYVYKNGEFVVDYADLIIEGGSTNYIPDPFFTDIEANYVIDDGGLIVIPHQSTVAQDKYSLGLKFRNTNFLNAFDTLSFKPKALLPIGGVETVTYSFYYKLYNYVGGELPPLSKEIKYVLYDTLQQEVGSITQPLSLAGATDWVLGSDTLSGIPNNVAFVEPIILLGAIETEEPQVFSLYGLQLERGDMPTSRIAGSTPSDIVFIPPIDYTSPLQIRVVTTHEAGHCRGILDNTINGVDGMQFFFGGDRLHLRMFDSAGALIVDSQSDVITAAYGNSVVYSVYVDSDSSSIIFKVDDTPLTTVSQATTLNYLSRQARLGSLFNSGTSINTPITEFGVFKI